MEGKEAKLFNPQKIKSNSNIHIIGKRTSGKTVLANKLLKQVVNEDDCGIIVGPCEVYLKEYIKKHANAKCFYKFTEKDYEQIDNSTNNYKFIVAENGNDLDKDLLEKLIESDILVIIIDQYPYEYNKNIKFDYVFSFKDMDLSYLQKTYENSYSPIMSLDNFLTNISKCKDYTCLVINKNNDKYYYYNAVIDDLEDIIDNFDYFDNDEFSSLCRII